MLEFRADLAHHVHDLARAAEANWSHEAVKGATGPATAEETVAALYPVARESAIELMVNFTSIKPPCQLPLT